MLASQLRRLFTNLIAKGNKKMEFGITFKGFVSPNRARNLVRQAEEAGFSYCWFYDSHILWREFSFCGYGDVYGALKTMRFGPCVTNPIIRDWSLAASLYGSLALQSEGRFDLGVGKGRLIDARYGQKTAPWLAWLSLLIKLKPWLKVKSP